MALVETKGRTRREVIMNEGSKDELCEKRGFWRVLQEKILRS